MSFKQGILLIALIAGGFATPILDAEKDLSIYFGDNSEDVSRVIGGAVAPEGSAPYMVALTTGFTIRSFTCGGSIVTKKTIVTAAHCIDGVFFLGSLLGSYRGTVGTNRWNFGGITFGFERNVTHPHYNANVIKNDIGLLVVKDELSLSDLVAPVALGFDFVDENVLVRATGWGRTKVGGPSPSQLQEIFKRTISGSDCIINVREVAIKENIRVPDVDPRLELCSFHSADNGVCHGDSGSALVRVDSNEQVGVVSWGIPCAKGGPDMYVRISAYRDFLENNVV